jgi:aspartyl protease family protein
MKVGYLTTVRIGNLSAANVQVNFIADDKLGGTHLLGMSFLDRFKMTIDDAHHELILLSK